MLKFLYGSQYHKEPSGKILANIFKINFTLIVYFFNLAGVDKVKINETLNLHFKVKYLKKILAKNDDYCAFVRKFLTEHFSIQSKQ